MSRAAHPSPPLITYTGSPTISPPILNLCIISRRLSPSIRLLLTLSLLVLGLDRFRLLAIDLSRTLGFSDDLVFVFFAFGLGGAGLVARRFGAVGFFLLMNGFVAGGDFALFGCDHICCLSVLFLKE